MPEDPQAKECPAGFQSSINDTFKVLFPQEQQQTFLGQRTNRQNLGASGENTWYYPLTAEDPLPFRELQSKVAYGMNLDGSTDGAATARTCAHENFVSPQGAAGIDNQLYRVLGCQLPFRKTGFVDDYFNSRIVLKTMNRILIEVGDVDDEMNDDEVTVTIYKGKDAVVTDAAGHVLPWTTQRVDERTPQYVHRGRGRIVDGTILSDPMDVLLPLHLVNNPGEYYIRNMRLDLKLTPSGADGLLAGYQDLEQFWATYATAMAVAVNVGPASGPAAYRALHRYADGYKEPATGKCTAISSAYNVSLARAFVVGARSNDQSSDELNRVNQAKSQTGKPEQSNQL